MGHENIGRDPFNQNFRKFRSITQWIGSVQPKKFRKHDSAWSDRSEFWLNGSRPLLRGKSFFCGVLRNYVSQNINAITRTSLLNRFDIADPLCCMYLIVRFSQLLRCEVVFHFINT